MKKSFTLIEIIVYMAVMSVFLIMISQAIMSISRNRLVAIARSQVVSNGNFALEKIKQAVLAANDFSVNAGNNELTIGNATYSLDSENNRIKVVTGSGGSGDDWVVAAAGDIRWNGNYHVSGDCLGKPSYKKGNDPNWLVSNGPMWFLIDMCGGAEVAYISSNSPDLPANPWFPAMSLPPAPTVSAGSGTTIIDYLTTNLVTVTNISFQIIGSGTGKTVKITTTIEYHNFLPGGQVISENFTTTVGLR